jgi:hypothetical protein
VGGDGGWQSTDNPVLWDFFLAHVAMVKIVVLQAKGCLRVRSESRKHFPNSCLCRGWTVHLVPSVEALKELRIHIGLKAGVSLGDF